MNSLVELLEKQTNSKIDSPLYTFVDGSGKISERLTYVDLLEKAKLIAFFLTEAKQSNQPVLLLYPPGIDYIVAFFGCLLAGAYAVPAYPPIDPRQKDRLTHLLIDSKTTCILTISAISPLIEQAYADLLQNGVQCIVTDTLSAEMPPNAWQRPSIAPDHIAFLQYTSGSTTNPRGVVLTHANLLHNLSLIENCFGIEPTSIGVSWLPPYHDMGLIGGILATLYTGTHSFLLSPLTFIRRPLLWLELISRHQATICGGPNFAYDLCVRKFKPELADTLDLSNWQVAFNGAETVRPATLGRFTKAYAACGFRPEAFLPCYGMAEATLIVSGTDSHKRPTHLTVDQAALATGEIVVESEASETTSTLISCGRIMSTLDVQIVNPQSRQIAPPNTIGEIWVEFTSASRHRYSFRLV